MKWAATKHKLYNKLVLERNTLTISHILTLYEVKCCGCGICADVCPEEAVIISPAKIRDGKLERKPVVDFDANRCTFCGECITLCPTNAIDIEVEGEQRIPVVEKEVFPTLMKEITLDPERCWWGNTEPDCDLACEKSCPTKAIDVIVKHMGRGKIGRIIDIKIDTRKCIFCKTCEAACPENAIHVMKPFQGYIELDTDLCPEGCQVCIDICPSEAISFSDEGKPVVNEQFCIYCGACDEVCPENLIRINRTRVLHTKVQSGAWITALERLASYTAVFYEVNALSSEKRKEIVKNTFEDQITGEN